MEHLFHGDLGLTDLNAGRLRRYGHERKKGDCLDFGDIRAARRRRDMDYAKNHEDEGRFIVEVEPWKYEICG